MEHVWPQEARIEPSSSSIFVLIGLSSNTKDMIFKSISSVFTPKAIISPQLEMIKKSKSGTSVLEDWLGLYLAMKKELMLYPSIKQATTL
jgi:hypothetical protein